MNSGEVDVRVVTIVCLALICVGSRIKVASVLYFNETFGKNLEPIMVPIVNKQVRIFNKLNNLINEQPLIWIT